MKGEEDVGDTVRTEPCPHRKKKRERKKRKTERQRKPNHFHLQIFPWVFIRSESDSNLPSVEME